MAGNGMKCWDGRRFKAADVGPLKELDKYSYTLPALSLTVNGKLFLKELLALTGVELSLNKLRPKESMPFYHRHRFNEEVYVFVSGHGQFRVDGKTFSVQEGTVVRVDPEGERTWRNISETEDLVYVVIQAPAGKLEAATTEDGQALNRRVTWENEETA